MSQHNPPYSEMSGTEERVEQPIEFERKDQEQPHLKWVVVESPDQAFRLEEDDYVLDSYYNPEYDTWEVLLRLEPADEDDD